MLNEKETDAKLSFMFNAKSFYADESQGQLSRKEEEWRKRFLDDRYEALYQFGFEEKMEGTSPSALFLYTLSEAFIKLLTNQPGLELSREHAVTEPSEEVLAQLLSEIPFMLGAEYITPSWIRENFRQLQQIYAAQITVYPGTVEMYLTEKNQEIRVPERVFFHLVESKDETYPFAFLATYASRDENGSVHHVPLKHALTEYKNERDKLLSLLSCLNKASEVSPLIAGFVESGELFHPLRLTSQEAYLFLKDIPGIEKSGILCRIPNWWKKRLSSVSLSVNMGEKKESMLGFETLVTMQPGLAVDGVMLTEEEIRMLLEQTEGLAWLKGRWIEVDHSLLQQLLKEMEQYQGQITLRDALRMELGEKQQKSADVGAKITNGKWLSELLGHLRTPSSIRTAALPKSFRAQLRPYQKTGYTWLDYMEQLGFGACLADDMGLGKTVQVLAFLEKMRKNHPMAHILLVVPASLLGNWQREAARFAPEMDIKLLHGKGAAAVQKETEKGLAYLTLTTYGMASRVKAIQEQQWDCVILDEAQAIKNPMTQQTKAVKKLKAKMRIAMTGTPIENELMNLWSIFDFLNKGLLGSSSEFSKFIKGLDEQPQGYGKLKAMVAPFILRRLKTDKTIISDLPDKLEAVEYAGLSKKQVVLYRKLVAELEKKLADVDGMERRGLVLSSITKLKQICNHPDQYLGEKVYLPSESGKFEMLKDLCETIYEKRERVLVFTQYKEITEYLAAFLSHIFHAKGYVLHGGTRIAKRQELVEAFNGEKYVPFLVLSVKAGGTGLNLTGANHVIHFDRWWNPAVENQATDRAFRIGQTKNVMVHKLVCEHTIEEKIDQIISSKKELAENVIGSGGEKWITELDNDKLLSMLRLDQEVSG